MVHINFQEPVTDKWKEWRKKCNDKQKECIANFANGEPLEIDDKL